MDPPKSHLLPLPLLGRRREIEDTKGRAEKRREQFEFNKFFPVLALAGYS
jgi:hypothetical protein